MELPQINPVTHAIGCLAERLVTVPSEELPVSEVAGRVLAASMRADRDSPPLAVSAMDGYAIRIDDARKNPVLPVVATTPAGSPPDQLADGTAIRIFTGAPVPKQADCVVRREDTRESNDQVEIELDIDALSAGLNIRRQGENIGMGTDVLPAGTFLGSAAMAAVASFSPATLSVRRKLRITILNTGDELAAAGAKVEPWQIRDSNGPVLESWLAGLPWAEIRSRRQVADEFDVVKAELLAALVESDAVLLTGGVSMGDADYVPGAIQEIGGEIAFHRLPIRPGRPVLGAHREGKLLLGLPGNPVSVAVTSRVFGIPLLRVMAGINPWSSRPTRVRVSNPDDQQLGLTWYRVARMDDDGQATLLPTRGSGDLVSLARSEGFVEFAPGQSGSGPWPWYTW